MVKYIALMRDRETKKVTVKEFNNSYRSKKEVIETIRFNGYQLVGGYVYTYEEWNNNTWMELRNELVELQKELRSFSKTSTCSLIKDIKQEIEEIKNQMKKVLN